MVGRAVAFSTEKSQMGEAGGGGQRKSREGRWRQRREEHVQRRGLRGGRGRPSPSSPSPTPRMGRPGGVVGAIVGARQGYRARLGEYQDRTEGVSLSSLGRPVCSSEEGAGLTCYVPWVQGFTVRAAGTGCARALSFPLLSHPQWWQFCRRTPGLTGCGVMAPPPSAHSPPLPSHPPLPLRLFRYIK